MRFSAAEQMLLGQFPSRELFEAAGRATIDEVRRISGVRWSSEYKEPALRSMVTRALAEVFDPATAADAQRAADRQFPAVETQNLASLRAAPPTSPEAQASGAISLSFTLNGQPVSVEAAPDATLLHVLRDGLGMTGTKEGCAVGECGACSVLLDGVLVNSCLTLAGKAAGRQVVTIEGIRGADGGPNDLQQAFIDCGAVQCGYCTPGMILAGEALLARTLTPSRDDSRHAIAGNLCRCTGDQQIVDAIQATADKRRTVFAADGGQGEDRDAKSCVSTPQVEGVVE